MVNSTIRSFDLAHLGHVELLTPKPQESLNFFVNVMGMTESGRQGQSVYLRGWDDYEFHTLKLTEHKTAGMGHFAFRASSPEALQHRVSVIEQAGYGKNDPSHVSSPLLVMRPSSSGFGRNAGVVPYSLS